jgi:hypothetical protein
MKADLPIRTRESLFEMIITALFSSLLFALYLNPNLLAIYQKGIEPIPMLIASSAKSLIMGFLLFSLIAFFFSLVKLIRKRWSVPLVWFSCMSELAGALYFAFFMTRWNALNKEFIRFFRNDLNTWALIAKAAAICFLLLTLISIVDDLYKVYKHR